MAKSKRIGKATDKDYLDEWRKYVDSFKNDNPVNLNETHAERLRRVARLEKSPEEWFRYYFPKYCSAEPTDFHKSATRRLLSHAEWFEVRAWSRELAKSARSMMEMCYLALTGKIHNVLLVSNSEDNAERLLMPFKAFFEASPRVTQDYGEQQTFGSWTSREFLIKKGCAFRALGWGQSPRGTRNENVRPDFILIDDIDTDEECRNEEIQKNKHKWIEQALFATRSVSCPTRILVNGNIIHNDCVVKKLGERADKFEIVNIRDAEGKSTWPAKNSEEDIDRVLSIISYESQQKEYFNNPMDGSDTFRNLKYGKLPRVKGCAAVIYADPSTSDREVTSGSYKAVGVVLMKDATFYVAKVFLDTMSNANFINALFSCYQWCSTHGLTDVRVWIENNSLQNPFFEQLLMPMIFEQSKATGIHLPVTGDARAKKDKYTRIEANLEPLHRNGMLVFNENEQNDPHMQRLVAQFANFSRKQKRMDGPDMVEGAVFKLKEMASVQSAGTVKFFKRTNSKKI